MQQQTEKSLEEKIMKQKKSTLELEKQAEGSGESNEACKVCGMTPEKSRAMYTTLLFRLQNQIFVECEGCGNPRVDPVGPCPQCDGMIFEFKDRIACLNHLHGECEFHLDNQQLDKHDMLHPRSLVNAVLPAPYLCRSDKERVAILSTLKHGWYLTVERIDIDDEYTWEEIL